MHKLFDTIRLLTITLLSQYQVILVKGDEAGMFKTLKTLSVTALEAALNKTSVKKQRLQIYHKTRLLKIYF